MRRGGLSNDELNWVCEQRGGDRPRSWQFLAATLGISEDKLRSTCDATYSSCTPTKPHMAPPASGRMGRASAEPTVIRQVAPIPSADEARIAKMNDAAHGLDAPVRYKRKSVWRPDPDPKPIVVPWQLNAEVMAKAVVAASLSFGADPEQAFTDKALAISAAAGGLLLCFPALEVESRKRVCALLGVTFETVRLERRNRSVAWLRAEAAAKDATLWNLADLRGPNRKSGVGQ